MFRNSHFALATHVLCALAFNYEKRRVTSKKLAESVGTNPAFLRTVLGQLRRAGLITINLGKGGGASLGRPPREISLWDVYRAVDDTPAITLHRCTPDDDCIVGRNILPVLEEVTADVTHALEQRLAAQTIADISHSVDKLG